MQTNTDLQLFATMQQLAVPVTVRKLPEGESSPVAPPVLRPAQERLAKRSRPGKAAKRRQKKPSAACRRYAPLNEGAKVDAERLTQEEAEPDKGNEQEQGAKPKKTQLIPEQRRNAFAKAMQQYPEEFEEAMQHAARMAVQSIRENPQLNELGAGRSLRH